MRLFIVTFTVLAILASALAFGLPAQASSVLPAAAGGLPFSVRITPAVLAWFNEVAGPDDIASFRVADLSLLDQVTAGRKQVIFPSAADAEQQMPALAGKVAIIGYDLEHWPQTPPDEQADPVAAVKRMRALADQYGLELAVGPDRRFTADYGTDLAPYADYYVLQLQRLQSDPETLKSFAEPLIQGLRQANPKLRVLVQLGTGSSVDEVVSALDSVQGGVDAVGLLTNASSLAVAREVVSRLKSGSPAVSPPAEQPDTLLPPETNPAVVPTPVPMPQPSLPRVRVLWRNGLIALGLAFGALIAAASIVLAVVMLVTARQRREGERAPERTQME